jgi:hypothetical protein
VRDLKKGKTVLEMQKVAVKWKIIKDGQGLRTRTGSICRTAAATQSIKK